MGKISLVKREAFSKALELVVEGKTRKQIVDFLVGQYLYANSEAYTLAGAAIAKVKAIQEGKIKA